MKKTAVRNEFTGMEPHPVHNDMTIAGKTFNRGWVTIWGIALIYTLLYALNLILPLESSPFFHYNNYTTRIWSWSEFSLAGVAFIVLLQRRRIAANSFILAFTLAFLSGGSIYLRNGGIMDAVQEGCVVVVPFVAGASLFQQTRGPIVWAFQGGRANVTHSLFWGAASAVPLAIINNLFFYLNTGSVAFKSGWYAALLALSPGISEEIIFRYFVIALCATSLQATSKERSGYWAILILAVVPHSLNHLPDLFLTHPAMAIFILVTTCLLFGLPMAVWQLKRNLETAVAFHWFIDFARFLFGY
ncbi:MAG: CPBP family intramembrane metalloprotease [Chloroflexi bacterium]|nr:CPBP family intramembrane metalloprotease [Chloroflexota bacterium]